MLHKLPSHFTCCAYEQPTPAATKRQAFTEGAPAALLCQLQEGLLHALAHIVCLAQTALQLLQCLAACQAGQLSGCLSDVRLRRDMDAADAALQLLQLYAICTQQSPVLQVC